MCVGGNKSIRAPLGLLNFKKGLSVLLCVTHYSHRFVSELVSGTSWFAGNQLQGLYGCIRVPPSPELLQPHSSPSLSQESFNLSVPGLSHFSLQPLYKYFPENVSNSSSGCSAGWGKSLLM